MATIVISDLNVRVGDGAFGKTAAVTTADSFDLEIKLTNKSSSSMKYWSVYAEFLQSDAVVAGRWVVGTGTGPNSGQQFSALLGSNRSRAETVTGIKVSDFGVGTGNNADTLRVTVYVWTNDAYYAGHDAYANDIWTQSGITLRGERHEPKIDTFEVRRNGNETAQLYLKAKGSYGVTPPDDKGFGETVVFEVSVNGGGWQTVSEDVITTDDLIAGVEGIMHFTLPTTSKASFRLKFYNEYETPSVKIVNVLTAFANVHLAGCKSGGVAIGKFSASTEGDPKFECAFPAYFQGGIFDGSGNEIGGASIVSEEKKIGTFLGKAMYRRVLSITDVPMGTTAVTTTLPGGLSIFTLVRMYGAYTNGTMWYPLNSYYSSSYYCYARLGSATEVITRATANMTRGYMVLEYTKD